MLLPLQIYSDSLNEGEGSRGNEYGRSKQAAYKKQPKIAASRKTSSPSAQNDNAIKPVTLNEGEGSRGNEYGELFIFSSKNYDFVN